MPEEEAVIDTENRNVTNVVHDVPGQINQDRLALLEIMAEYGSRGAEYFEEAATEWNDRQAHDSSVLRGSAAHLGDTTASIYQEEYDQITAGIAQGISDVSIAHEQEMLRIQAANDAYLQQVMAAAPIHAQEMDRAIEMAQDALEALAAGGTGSSSRGGGGGRGGGGSGSGPGSPGTLPGDGDEADLTIRERADAAGLVSPDAGTPTANTTAIDPEALVLPEFADMMMEDPAFMALAADVAEQVGNESEYWEIERVLDQKISEDIENGLLTVEQGQQYKRILLNSISPVTAGSYWIDPETGEKAEYGTERMRELQVDHAERLNNPGLGGNTWTHDADVAEAARKQASVDYFNRMQFRADQNAQERREEEEEAERNRTLEVEEHDPYNPDNQWLEGWADPSGPSGNIRNQINDRREQLRIEAEERLREEERLAQEEERLANDPRTRAEPERTTSETQSSSRRVNAQAEQAAARQAQADREATAAFWNNPRPAPWAPTPQRTPHRTDVGGGVRE